jgi:hypothetical protein
MTSQKPQQTLLQRVSSMSGTALVVLALVGLLGGPDQSACWLGDLFIAAARVALSELPTVVLAIWQAWHPCSLDHARLLEGFLQISASSWPFILALAAGV